MDTAKLDALVNESELHSYLFKEDGHHFPLVYETALQLLEQEGGAYTPGEGYFHVLLMCFEDEAKTILLKNDVPLDFDALGAMKGTDAERPEIAAARRVLWLVWRIQYLQAHLHENDTSMESLATRLLTLFHALLNGATEHQNHDRAGQSRP